MPETQTDQFLKHGTNNDSLNLIGALVYLEGFYVP
jgi:hypothetical protein